MLQSLYSFDPDETLILRVDLCHISYIIYHLLPVAFAKACTSFYTVQTPVKASIQCLSIASASPALVQI